jgi:hypothetical protein
VDKDSTNRKIVLIKTTRLDLYLTSFSLNCFCNSFIPLVTSSFSIRFFDWEYNTTISEVSKNPNCCITLGRASRPPSRTIAPIIASTVSATWISPALVCSRASPIFRPRTVKRALLASADNIWAARPVGDQDILDLR